MTSNELKLICNYHEITSPIKNVSYIDFNSDDDKEELRKLKEKNRSLAIDAVLEDKIEEYNNRDKISIDENELSSSYGTISPIVRTIQVSPIKFKSFDDIWDLVISHIEKSTSSNNIFMSKNNIPSMLSFTPVSNLSNFDNQQTYNRRILTRILSCSNMIATEGRTGPATTIIIGENILEHINSSSFSFNPINNNNNNRCHIGTLQSMDVVVSDKIDPNKIICTRSELSSTQYSGLSIINDTLNGEFYMYETHRTFEKKFFWFKIS